MDRDLLKEANSYLLKEVAPKANEIDSNSDGSNTGEINAAKWSTTPT